MKVVKFGEKIPKRAVICLGYFGCLHVGHLALLDKAKSLASELDAQVALMTFSDSPKTYFGLSQKTLFTFEERKLIFADQGIDHLIASPFDKAVATTSGAEFLKAIAEYEPVAVVCGYDYTCGCDKLSASDVKSFFASICPVCIVGAVCLGGEKVSTISIEKLLTEGKIEQVNSLLSEPYFICGTVVHGRGVGHTIGFPTANIAVDSSKLLPYGVFVGEVVIDGSLYRAIVNIGAKPTFGVNSSTVEAHVIGYDGDLYGKQLKLVIKRFIRNVETFACVDELVLRLNKDKEIAQRD